MRKATFAFVGAAICALTLMSSCKSDKTDVTAPVKSEKTYAYMSGLDLKVNGRPMTGCTATYTPGEEGNKASVRISGMTVDINNLLGQIINLSSQTKAELIRTSVTANVLPGSPVIYQDLTMDVDGDTGNFEGKGKTDFCSYTYKGSVTESELKFYFENIKMNNTELENTTWSPILKSQTDRLISFEWKYTQKPEFPLNEIIQQALAEAYVTIDDQQVTLDQALAGVLTAVNFKDSGDWTIKYRTQGKVLPTELPIGIVNYVTNGKDQVRFFLNIGEMMSAIITNATKGAEQETLQKIMQAASVFVAGNLNNGIMMRYEKKGDDLYLTLDSEILKQLLTSASTLLSDQGIQALLMQAIQELDPEEQQLAMSILTSLQDNILKTESINLGVRLTKSSL